METKKCKKCNEVKMIGEFYKNSRSKDKLCSQCKDCTKVVNQEWNIGNKEQIKIYNTEYNSKNNEDLKLKFKESYYNNLEYHKTYNKTKSKELVKQNNQKQMESGYQRKWQNSKYKTNPLYRLSKLVRKHIWGSFKGLKKTKKSQVILGCSFEEFKLYLENKFEPWMEWENLGNPKDGIYELNKTWDIDHIIPISSAKTEEDIMRLNHYLNLQPLCSYINRFIKRDKSQQSSQTNTFGGISNSEKGNLKNLFQNFTLEDSK